MKLNISFFIKDDEWLDKCKIWDKVSKSIKKDLIVKQYIMKNI